MVICRWGTDFLISSGKVRNGRSARWETWELHLWGCAGPPSSIWEAERTHSQGWLTAAYHWDQIREKRSVLMEPRAGKPETACLPWAPLRQSFSERLDLRTTKELHWGEKTGRWHQGA